MSKEEQLIQKLRNDLLAGADTMISTGHNTEDELFPLFCKLFPNKSEKEVKGIFIATATKCELVYGAPCEAINTFDAITKLYVAFLYYKADDKKEFDYDKELFKAYIYVYSQLYINTLPEFYQRGSAIEYSESLDKEQEAIKWFALTLDRCGFKNPNIYETYPGIIVLQGEKYYGLTSVKPRSVKYPKVTNRVSGLSIGYDMFTLKFKELTD